jgi:hypothetical protein
MLTRDLASQLNRATCLRLLFNLIAVTLLVFTNERGHWPLTLQISSAGLIGPNDNTQAWKAYWKAQGQPWCTESEIDVERQKYLVRESSTV